MIQMQQINPRSPQNNFYVPIVYPEITVHVTPSSPEVQGPVELSCEAVAGDLPISYSWTDPNDQTLSPGDTDGTITVNISSYGTYTCTATNDIGTRRATLETGM